MAKKYTADKLLAALRPFAKARNDALAAGFTDNGGAIHSVERIVEILCRAVCFPEVSHPSNLRKSPRVEISKAAHIEREKGNWDDLWLEHVMPQRAYARDLCECIETMTDEDVIAHIKATYRVCIITRAEQKHIDKINRSRMTPDRIAEAGIELHSL
ncbi:hypothetical protein [Erythrobacter sp. Alg231-14]|uniref:hypothetical protein n=1 Tax=Erythrobacter sp. Alg231-14 TaxID=1922225 RepID=UPI000D556780